MTTAYICDRCGTSNESPTGNGRIHLKILGRPMYRDYTAGVDLCDDCEESFAEFMGPDGEYKR